jgi:hypothetical protein
VQPVDLVPKGIAGVSNGEDFVAGPIDHGSTGDANSSGQVATVGRYRSLARVSTRFGLHFASLPADRFGLGLPVPNVTGNSYFPVRLQNLKNLVPAADTMSIATRNLEQVLCPFLTVCAGGEKP